MRFAVTSQDVGLVAGGDRPAADVVEAALRWYEAQAAAGKPALVWVHLGDLVTAAAGAADSRAAYVAALGGVDEALATLGDRLGGKEKVALVATSGLALGENGETLHGLTLADGVIRVSALLRGLAIANGAPAGFGAVHAALARAAGDDAGAADGPIVVTIPAVIPPASNSIHTPEN